MVLAHMWLNLSAANGSKNALEKCEMVANEMTIEQIETAQKMAGKYQVLKN